MPKKYFGRFRKPLTKTPNLVISQVNSFKWLIEKGLKEVFDEFSSIKDFSERKFQLDFVSFELAEPKFDEYTAKERKLSYEAPLKVRVRLKNLIMKTEKEQEIFMADMPLMTSHGTFIISGIERVVVPQLARSTGVSFTAQELKGKKTFGAKIIPGRGAWIEMETDHDGTIYVRIDRKRKFPVTTLLRAFGVVSNDKISNLFSAVPEAKHYLEKTFAKDHTTSVDEAAIEIHRRLRDGDLAAAENAREFVRSIFDKERYDLSRVGRFRFNNRFGIKESAKEIERRTPSLNDFVLIISHIIHLNSTPGSLEDDIDHLGSRRVRFVGELFQQKVRVGMAQIKRNIQNRMSTIDTDVTLPVQFISPKPLQARMKEFFTTNQLSQFMQQTNALEELEHLRTVSALGPGGLSRARAGYEVRDVHPSHYGRLCPIQTPEGPNIGLILRLASYARVNDFGMIETPYAAVSEGKITGEIKYLNALEEEHFNITHAATPVEDDFLVPEIVEVRHKGTPATVPRNQVHFIDVATNQAFSIVTSMIPFLNHDDANRALMGSNMQKQATPCVIPEAPLVSTGIEEVAIRDTGRIVFSDVDGTVSGVDAKSVTVKDGRGKEHKFPLVNFSMTNGFTAFHQRPSVELGQKVKSGAVLADTSSSAGGQMAIGQNVLVAFMSWSGANYEDAIIISERLVEKSKFTSIDIREFTINVRDTKLGPEMTTCDIPNVGESKLKNLAEDGIVRVGAEVRPGDILVGKITPKGESQLTPEERLLRSLFGEKARDVKDTSKRMESGQRGRVISVQVFSREKGDKLDSGILKQIHVQVAQLRNVSVGDKLAGRHGNKGVISRILPAEDMPYMADGTPIDVILTPLGVPSRMNLGQILEMHLGLAAYTLNYQAVVPPFAGASEEEIKEELVKAGKSDTGKVKLFDGRTGEAFDQDIAIGYMYIMKLHHMVEDKIHMRSIGPYSLITQQPLGGKAQNGGQRFGEMEVWALLGHGASYTLREMLTIKSDDILGRSAAFDAIVKGEKIPEPHLPASFNVLLNNLRGLALDVELKKKKMNSNYKNPGAETDQFEAISIKLASPERIKEWSHGEVTKPETINYRTQRSERNGLFDEKIFGPDKDFECYCGKYRGIRYKGIVCEKCGVEITRSIVRRERMGHIELASPVSHIWFLKNVPSRISLVMGIPVSDLEKVIYFAGYIVTSVSEEEKARVLKDLDSEFKSKSKVLQDEKSKLALKELALATRRDIEALVPGKVLNEVEYHRSSVKYPTIFEAGIGAEAIYDILKKIDLSKLLKELEAEFENAPSTEIPRLNKRISTIQWMINASIRPEWMFLSRIPVIPPAIRPMVPLDGGRYATSDVNDLYRRVINRNNRLKKLKEINAPDVILRNEKRILQEAVDALIDNTIRHSSTAGNQSQRRPLKSLSDNLKGKRGLFRQNLLGKRVDYSGRSVIVVGPDLKLHQCGLPKHMALELFKPFIISELLKRELSFNIPGARRLIEDAIPEVWAILEEVIRGKYVLLNRAPTLHRLGIQAFQPVLIEGNAIQLHPLVCTAFNADFDGDQMAVHVPLSEEAQAEARLVMAADRNILKPGNGEPVVSAKLLDIVLGSFWMTRAISGERGEGRYYSSPNSAITAYEFGVVSLRAKIHVLPTDTERYKHFDGKTFETTVGRLLFNGILPKDYPFLNHEMSRKKMSELVDNLIERYGIENIPAIMDKIKNFGFRYATFSGVTWGLGDVKIPEGKKSIIEKGRKAVAEVISQYQEGLLSEGERIARSVEIWQGVKGEVEKLIPGTLGIKDSVYDMTYSEARGSFGNLNQMAGMKGVIANVSGDSLEFPILSCYKEGLTPLEYFITTHGSRKGLIDTALNTAKAGYLTRRLFDVAQDEIVTEDDCGAKEGTVIHKKTASGIEIPLSRNVKGRFLATDLITPPAKGEAEGVVIFKRGHFITKSDAETIDKSDVESATVRSPLACKSIHGICVKCYGTDLGNNKVVELGEAVGTVAAQAIGEPGTQLTMRTFHAGGVASAAGDITAGLPRVEEIFEKRKPKNPAIISHLDGLVTEIKSMNNDRLIVVAPEHGEIKGNLPARARQAGKLDNEYTISTLRAILVRVGQKVSKGDILTDGSVDLDELFRYAGREKTENYIIHEVSKLYELQGAAVSHKHIELIVRQMFSRRKVRAAGDSHFTRGDVIEVSDFVETNNLLREKGLEEAKADPVIMGITEVSLSRASFLSAASFQHTPRVLIQAAIKGVEDALIGLKENVIIGRLIPAGTSFKGGYKEKLIWEAISKQSKTG